MQQRVLELIPRIANEQLTEELLIVNDNLNNVFLRHERYPALQQPTLPFPPTYPVPWSPHTADLSSPLKHQAGHPRHVSSAVFLQRGHACPAFQYLSSPRQLGLPDVPASSPRRGQRWWLSVCARSQAGWSVLAHSTAAWLWGLGPLTGLN